MLDLTVEGISLLGVGRSEMLEALERVQNHGIYGTGKTTSYPARCTAYAGSRDISILSIERKIMFLKQ